MPKLLMMRPLIAAALLSLGMLAVIVGWQVAPSGSGGVFGNFTWLDQDDRGRRQRELRFLKAAFDRLEAEAQRDPNGPATPSLRGEQDMVLKHMRDVARPLPADAISDELRLLFRGEAAAAPQTAVVLNRPPEPADGPAALPELQIGLSPPAPAVELGVSRDPGLGVIVLVARPRPRPVPPDGTAGMPSVADGKPVAKPRPAEKPASTPPASDIIGRSEPARPAAVSAFAPAVSR